MRAFDFRKTYDSLLTPDVVAQLTAIHEYRGEQTLFIEANADVLTQLLEDAKVQSTEASNRIEGIVTTSERLKMIVKDKTMPKTRNEKEIAGYRDVLNTIHESYEYIPPRPSMILQLHRDLFKFSGSPNGGNFKNSDNSITETLTDGTVRVRFQPLHAWETPEAMDSLCQAFDQALSDTEMDPLILITLFVFDFLCIHPFNDGNGRISRLLTLLLLYRAGYIVGKYVSIEKLIADTKDTYYDVLQASSFSWHEGTNDYGPFVRYMLGIIVAAYRDFSSRVTLLTTSGLTKADRIRELIRTHIGNITKAQILAQFPDISHTTAERTLATLLEKGEITKIGGGRYTSYVWNGEE